MLKNFGIGLPGQKILDQGTGTGVFGRQLARQGCNVIGTDISEVQINYATQLAEEEELKNIEFLVSPAEVNPFPETHQQCNLQLFYCLLFLFLDPQIHRTQ